MRAKLTAIILFTFIMQVSATGFAQKITLTRNNITLDEFFREIKKQTGYNVSYSDKVLNDTKRVNLSFRNVELKSALEAALAGESLSFEIIDKDITIIRKEPSLLDRVISVLSRIDIRGKVVDPEGNALPGASIKVKGTGISAVSDARGEFVLSNVDEKEMIEISYLGFTTAVLKATDSFSAVALERSQSKLDEVQVIAYGTTTRRLSTGNVGTVKATDIAKQPVSNPLAALIGRVPGLLITPSNGMPGSAMKVQLRGQSTIGTSPGIRPATDPLFIVDGVPFAPNNTGINAVSSAVGAGGFSPLSSLSPDDIESIDVLKDADATAIYGSRGANGVVLITTKRGKKGKLGIAANVQSGISDALRNMDMLNTQQYVAMRKEALKNDGLTPTVANAPDLMVWDTTRYTDFKKLFIDNQAKFTNANLSISGGSANTQVLFSSSFNRETHVLPNAQPSDRAAFSFRANHASNDQKFKLDLSANYSAAVKRMPNADITSQMRLIPNAPVLTDEFGKLRWSESGITFSNPLASMRKEYKGNINNLIANSVLSYQLLPELQVRGNLGYNILTTNENRIEPIESKSPTAAQVGSSFFGNSEQKSWIIEPQLEFNKITKLGKLTALAGATWQELLNTSVAIDGTGYTSDLLLRSQSAAVSTSILNGAYQYNYTAIFGRLGYNLNDKYLLNLSGRRDGSSRFGPASRFGNFWAAGGAWVFSNERVIKNMLPALSFGKLRASYGKTGNDQIGDYAYLNLWTVAPVANAYQGLPALLPTSLYNPDFAWEENKKLELGVDLGFFTDRILLSAAWYRNRSSNLLISEPLAFQAGANSVANKNFPGVVQNTGLELLLTTANVKRKNFSWTSSFNLTVPKNVLKSFPNLANSNYASTLIVGEPLSATRQYQYTGVDPATGLYTVLDVNGDKVINETDRFLVGDLEPRFYGGFSSMFTYKNLQLDLFFDGKSQDGFNYIFSILGSIAPGSLNSERMNNMPVAVIDRWQKPGDVAAFQRYSTSTTAGEVGAAIAQFKGSNASYVDASYIRLRTASMAYTFKLKPATVKVFLQGQNLMTFTNYKGMDPETQAVYGLPPMRTVTGGIQLNF